MFKTTRRHKRVVSSFKQFIKTVQIMENDEICFIIASLFIEFERRVIDKKEAMKCIEDIKLKILDDKGE